MNHISIDLETLSNRPNASIVSIGAVDTLGREFYQVVDDPDGHISPTTIRWHIGKGSPRETIGVAEDARYVNVALHNFQMWLMAGGAHEDGKAAIWGHATFDPVVLANAFYRCGYPSPPWHYRNCLDLRTMYLAAGGRPELPSIGTAHHALDDAKYQLEEIKHCLRIVRPDLLPEGV